MAQKIVLKDDKTLEKWSVLLQDGQGKGSEIFRNIASTVESSRVPGIKVEMARVFPKVAPGFLDARFFKGIEKQGRDYLMIINENIKAMRLLVGAQDYGTNLYISWYLICEPNAMSKAFGALFTKPDQGDKWSPIVTSVFMEEELTAYTTLVHHSVLNAVEKLMTSTSQDFSKVDRKSRGFMGIS